MFNNVQSGHYGQKAAEDFLREKGMTLKEANFKVSRGEIDLIMKDSEYIVFVEVKYRRGLEYGLPREAVNFHKQQQIKKVALHYIARKRLQNQDFRFDVVELLEMDGELQINHIENAFW